MKVINLKPYHNQDINDIERIPIDAFGESKPGKWKEDINKSLGKDRISLAVINEGNTIAWIGGIKKYSGNVWELHPLVIHKKFRQNGLSTSLVTAFEEKVREKGGVTIWLGSDDEDDSTSLSNVDLYDNLYNKLKNIENKNHHPYEFYQKLGYKVVGVLPDANGIGKPDIFLAKRVGQ